MKKTNKEEENLYDNSVCSSIESMIRVYNESEAGSSKREFVARYLRESKRLLNEEWKDDRD